MLVKLYTRDGGFVTDLTIPPFDPAPEAIIWGERFFLLRERQTYREGMVYAAPPAEVLA